VHRLRRLRIRLPGGLPGNARTLSLAPAAEGLHRLRGLRLGLPDASDKDRAAGAGVDQSAIRYARGGSDMELLPHRIGFQFLYSLLEIS